MATRKFKITAAIAGAALAGAAVTGTAFAVAGSTTNGDIVADNTAISSCDTSWDLAFGPPAYDATDGRYEISTVSFSNVASPACNGQTMAVTVVNSSGAVLGDGTATISGSTGTITLSAGADAAAATSTSAAIYE